MVGILLGISFLTLVMSAWLLIRNIAVYNYRGKLLDLVFDERPGDKLGAWQERHKYYATVSYNEMVYKFWKPISSFYDERKFK